ncbi:hypothetical protein B7486_72115 [cyanobacterium TDX16]|nr:hypothetical protein B7486_72115 [cyanobacterium TDX16]
MLGRPAAAIEPPPGLGGDPVDNAVENQQRALHMATLVAARHQVPVVVVSQAVASSGDPDSGFVQAAERLAPEIVDLTAVLAGEPDVFVDEVRTNERGARHVAEALWPLLVPHLEAATG